MDEKIENIRLLLKNEFGDNNSGIFLSLDKYRRIKIERLQALNVYTIRHRIKLGKVEANKIIGYPRLLKSLAGSKDSDVLIHMLHGNDEIILVFTDVKASKIMGYLTNLPLEENEI